MSTERKNTGSVSGAPPDDACVALAMDRVLEAERLARSAIAECEKQCHESLEQARRERRAVLERAQQRIITLHTRAARALEQRVAQIRKPRGPAAGAGIGQHPDRVQLQAAIEHLADRLIGPGGEEN
jgi:uncharacterized membrane protein YccC